MLIKLALLLKNAELLPFVVLLIPVPTIGCGAAIGGVCETDEDVDEGAESGTISAGSCFFELPKILIFNVSNDYEYQSINVSIHGWFD